MGEGKYIINKKIYGYFKERISGENKRSKYNNFWKKIKKGENSEKFWYKKNLDSLKKVAVTNY